MFTSRAETENSVVAGEGMCTLLTIKICTSV